MVITFDACDSSSFPLRGLMWHNIIEAIGDNIIFSKVIPIAGGLHLGARVVNSHPQWTCGLLSICIYSKSPRYDK